MTNRAKIKRQIIKHLYFGKSCSSTELSVQLNRSIPYVIEMVNELLEEDILRVVGMATSKGGRRATLYGLKPDLLYVMAVAIDRFETRMILYDLHNNQVGEMKILKYRLTPGGEKDLGVLTEAVSSFIEQHEMGKNKILGIGISMPGFIDNTKNINYSFISTPKENIVKYMEAAIELPIFIDNDSSLVALAEFKFGRTKTQDNVMTLNLEWGIGLGMVLNGEIFRGSKGFAGELSHIPLFDNKKICQCGKRGCLETESSLIVLIDKARKMIMEEKMDLPEWNPKLNEVEVLELVLSAAKSGNTHFIKMISALGYTLGRGVSILIHLLNPSTIILSGQGSSIGHLWTSPIQQAINEHCIPQLAENIQIEISSLGKQASLLGGASLVMDKYDKLSKPKSKTSIIQ